MSCLWGFCSLWHNFGGEQPTVRIACDLGNDLGNLHRKTIVIGRGETTQNPLGYQTKAIRQQGTRAFRVSKQGFRHIIVCMCTFFW